MEGEDLPYRAEYAKTGRASCKACKTSIAKDVLRLAVMVRSPMFDGKVPHWYHVDCFFNKQRPKSVGDISHYESLRYEDQQAIKTKIDSVGSAPAAETSKKGKGKKRTEKEVSAGPSDSALKDFTVEYAKSSRALCRGCEQKIQKNEVRISKKDFESDVGKRYGGQDLWHHIECFAQLRSELSFFESGEKITGFETLSEEDKNEMKKALPVLGEIPIKKPKLEEDNDKKKIEKQVKKQSELIFKYRDGLKILEKKKLKKLLTFNDQDVGNSEDAILDCLSDAMAFGSLEKCSVCKNGQLVFNKMGYICQGDLTEWTKCNKLYTDPKRKNFVIPDDCKEIAPVLKKYKAVVQKRIINYTPPSTSTAVKKEDETDSMPKVVRKNIPPLYKMNFVLSGFSREKKKELEKAIVSFGGIVVNTIQNNSVVAVIATEKDATKLSAKVKEAKEKDVHVVSEDFVKEAADHAGDIPSLVIKKSICDFGSDPKGRLPEIKSEKSTKSSSVFTKSGPSSRKVNIKGGGVVDPDSGLEDTTHVYREKDDLYNAVLGLADLQKQKNSFYKLQLLESDSGSVYWVFRSWGRISTAVGGHKIESQPNLQCAKSLFKSLYKEKTGNDWHDRAKFVKISGKMYPVDIDYDDGDVPSMEVDTVPSKLDRPVQDLIKIIFDINSMKRVMKEFELDLEKMPLGKLSKSQIQSAFSVLSELQKLVDENGPESGFLDASNRFYTFIPHSFGMDNPPVINTSKMVKEKLEMLDSLMELEVAYNLIKGTEKSSTVSAVDSYYERLKCDLEVLDKKSKEYKLILQYVKNTHAATHSYYELEVAEVFVLKRHGENKRFETFQDYPNRKLLWHGSRTTNFVGLLSQGLRIAPKEAPVTGYMFGKGIYFADMVSKSANYCCTSYTNPTGLMLLCDVALGTMYERSHADYIEKLPEGKHSTKGLGQTHPDPSQSVFKDGLEIPVGKGVKVPNVTSGLLYNEYIVYDVNQVNMKYLVKMNFKFQM